MVVGLEDLVEDKESAEHGEEGACGKPGANLVVWIRSVDGQNLVLLVKLQTKNKNKKSGSNS